jgi:FtsP/CotA-like multicopper oxidase with cupredoxin domain
LLRGPRVAIAIAAIAAVLAASGCAPRLAPQPGRLSIARFDYWRFPSPQSWRYALARTRQAGYDAVAIDFYWGYHSARPGAYDFSGIRDLDRLLSDAAAEGLYVVPQIGPYIDADAEAGGLPDWMLARGRNATTIPARYARESSVWRNHISAILSRHRLGGGGSVIASQAGPFPVAVEGIDWGWTGDPQRFGGPYDGVSADARELHGAPLQAVLGWRAQRDDAEAARIFDDQAWPPLLSGYPPDPDEPQVRNTASWPAKASEFLGADEYGFHRGVVWYRGHFTASGTERALRLRGLTGRGGALSVWLDGIALGSAAAGPDGAIAATFPIAASTLRRGERNALAVLVETAGHGEDADQDLRHIEPRGMLAASMIGASDAMRWQILGNGEYNTDPVRGALNSGGLAGEIAGWQMPNFSDRVWIPVTLPTRFARAGVVWYRAHADLDGALPRGTFPALRIDDPRASSYRAFIYVNGWLIGRYVSGFAPHVFPIPPGIAPGENASIAIATWNLRNGSGLGRVSLTEVDGFPDPHAPLPDVPQVRSASGIARLALNVTAGADLRPRFFYRGRVGAPTIRVWPGETIEIAIHNGMPRSTQTADALNLHFHGLNVAPLKPGDDVLMTLARPGQTLAYRVSIPKNQPPGLYWYHPHSHGETYWQVTSGMAGAIVVEGIARRVPELGAMRERLMIVRDVQDAADILSIPWYARRMTPRYSARFNDENGTNRACLPELGLHLTVNGLVQPAIALGEGERQFFRLLNASASRVLDLAIDGERLGIVAVDGYPVGAAAGNAPILWSDHVIVPPGGRVEFLATGLARATVLRTRCYDSGSGGDRDPPAVLAVLQPETVSSGVSVPQTPAATDRSMIGSAAPAARRTITLSEGANGFAIDGRSFRMGDPPAIAARAGTLEEWTIRNRSNEVHAFHIHQVHFLVESADGVPAHLRLWRDTVLVRKRVTILVDFRSPATRGTFVFHCHMLDHEDGGMMAVIKVI